MTIFFKMVLMNIKSQLEYKKAFIISTLGSFFITFLLILSIDFLFKEFKTIGEWDFYQVSFLFGIVYLNFALAEMFLRGLDHFDYTIRKGEFDRILIRPRNLLIQSTSTEFELSKIGRITQSIIIIVTTIIKLQIKWNLYKLIILLFINIGLFMIFFGSFILKASFCFWTIDGLEFMNIISEGGKKVSQYPINIYEKWFRIIFTIIFPFGMVNYYPVLYLFGKVDKWYLGLTPLLTIPFFLICVYIWTIGVKHYESTGS